MQLKHRLLPITNQDRQTLLTACNVQNMEDLLLGIPKDSRFNGRLNCSESQSEFDIKKQLKKILKNSREAKSALSFLGAGVYERYCPSVVNQLTLRGEFLTSYTPYQPEMAQGTLQALFEFQSIIASLFGMDLSNASHYDGSTSAAESALMALRIKATRKRILISEGVHPEYIQVIKTYLNNLDAEVFLVPLGEDGLTSQSALKSILSNDVALFIAQSPNFYGCIEDMENLCALTQKAGALFSANVTEMLSLALLKTPGDYGADIATGEGQSLGLPQSYGGPYLGLFTSKMDYVRQVPGRLCGETTDAKGRKSYTLTLSTREQHIRREKATSNICTNQNLCALWVTIWASLVGKETIIELAEQNLSKAEYAKDKILKTGKAKLRYTKTNTFNEFVIDLKTDVNQFLKECLKNNVAPGLNLNRFNKKDKSGLLVAITETKSKDDIDLLVDLIHQFV